MRATQAQELNRLHTSTSLQSSDFDNAVFFRQSEPLFAAPAQYDQVVSFRVCNPDFTFGTKQHRCNFGDMIITGIDEDGQLRPSEVLPGAEYNNRFKEMDLERPEGKAIAELFRIARFHEDHFIWLGAENPRKFLLCKGGYAALALRANGNHVVTPVELEINEMTGRPKIPARYTACDEFGRSLAARKIISVRGR